MGKMRNAIGVLTFVAIGLLVIPWTLAGPVNFTFEAAGPGGDDQYGSQDPQGFFALVRNGFVIDVVPSGTIHGALHWHEVDSLSNFKVPNRLSDEVEVQTHMRVPGRSGQ